MNENCCCWFLNIYYLVCFIWLLFVLDFIVFPNIVLTTALKFISRLLKILIVNKLNILQRVKEKEITICSSSFLPGTYNPSAPEAEGPTLRQAGRVALRQQHFPIPESSSRVWACSFLSQPAFLDSSEAYNCSISSFFLSSLSLIVSASLLL